MISTRFAVTAFAALAASSGAFANIIDLTDGNSTVTIDTASQNGMSSWVVDGVDQLTQQWFWFRIGNTSEQSIDTLNQIGVAQIDTNPFTDTNFDTFSVLYADTGSNYQIELNYTLRGGAGAGQSNLSEQITIRNTSAGVLDFHFIQYSDFSLNGDSADDAVMVMAGNSAIQSDPFFTLAEAVVSQAPDHFEAGLSANLLASLNDGTATTLSDAAGPVLSGNVGWAFQWGITLQAGESFLISKNKSIQPGSSPLLPSPGAAALLAMGGLVIGRKRRN